MKNRILISALLLAAFGAGAAPWFDARIGEYENWPEDAAKATGGEWANAVSATQGSARLQVSSADAGSSLEFRPHVAKKLVKYEPSVYSTVRFCNASEDPIEIDSNAKGAITVVEKADGALAYLGLVKDALGETNRWEELFGETPVVDRDVALTIAFTNAVDGAAAVCYTVDGVGLTNRNGVACLPIAASPDAEIRAVSYTGEGEVASLSGEALDSVPVVLVVPDVANATIEWVKVGDETIAAVDGKYPVASGATVRIKFAPAAGYALSVPGGVVTIDGIDDSADEFEVAVGDLPVAVDVATAIKINEVMASNGETLATANGGAELDWMELRNDADNDVDLTGWYIGDDPTKKPAKWVQIQGSCVVPAHGCKIVWCDKSYANWAEGEAHAAFGIGKSGGTLFLADEQDKNAIRVQMELPAQMKDVSYGLGRREKTVLDKFAPAQYRVGSGEWMDCSGSLGMPGATNGFKVTSYKLDKESAANIPAVEAALASGKFAPVATVHVDTIAYSNANSSVKTSPEFAPYYRHVSTLGPGVITGSYYAFLCEGTVWIPRAGDWTFCVGSDDGFELTVSNDRHSFQSEFTGGRGYGLTPAIFRIQEPGAYNVRLLYFQGTGSASLDFSVKEGDFDDYENFSLDGFRLVGLPESGVTHAGEWAGYAVNDVSGEMLGVSDTLQWKSSFTLGEAPAADDVCRLKVKFADGFTASVNGRVVANVPAAGQRSLADALVPAVVDVPASFLAVGENAVEITAANDSADSAEFLLAVEATVTKAAEEPVYFREPTPGAANTTAGYGPATPKVAFSEPHGWKTGPVSVALSCAEAPEAQIYYTLDGTSPTTSSTLYTGPIAVSSTTCIRAAIPQEGAVIQLDASATYLYLDDVLAQERGVVPAGFPTKDGNGNYPNSQAMLYGMNLDNVPAADYDRLLNGFTNSVATMSIVIDPHNLFDNVEGIYVNAVACDGREWERLTMVEQIDPKNDANGFSTAAGIRIRGAFSRKPGYPKHSLRLFFRNDYGDGPLEFPLFGDEGAGKFKKVDLRTSQNYAWANGYTTDTFIHEVFSRDSQRDMGDLYTRSRYYNLFINGHYWGLYQTQERGDNDFAETYNGGDSDMYDVIKTSQPGYVTGASEGTIDAWEALWNLAVNEGFSGEFEANYKKAMGLDPDGTRNPEYPVYLNPTNLMDYMICAHYVVDSDSPASRGNHPNNLYAVRDRDDNDEGLKSQGFFYLRHDAEHSMGENTSYTKFSHDPTGYGTTVQSSNFLKSENFNPAELHFKLCDNPEYRMAFADRFYYHCLREGGAFTVEKATERFTSRMAEIDDVIVCESARWATKGQTRQTWLDACGGCLNFITNRMPYMVSQYRKRGWYPSVAVPAAVDADGNRIAPGTELPEGATVKFFDSEANAAYADGTVYYTTDGTDPRLEGGTVAEGANACPAAGLVLPEGGATLTLRYLSASGEWSAIDTVVLQAEVKSDQFQGVRVFAVNSCTKDGDGDGSEFIVLTNLLDRAVSLEGLRFTCAKTGSAPKVDVTLGAGREIPANGTVTLTKADDWPTMKITNGAVDMLVYDSAGETVQTLHFEATWWDNACKGTGAYFVAKEFGTTVTAIEQWTYQAPPDWPENPAEEITEETQPADLGITGGAFTNAAPAVLVKLATWAKANDVQFGSEAVNGMSFDAGGNPKTVLEEAYLLNCAVAEVEDKKAEFGFDSIVPGEVPEIKGDFNGTVHKFGATTLENGGNWSESNLGTAKFFKAILVFE